MAKIHKNDQVIVIGGRDKGKEGRVLEIIKDPKTGIATKAVVEGINFVKQHNRVQQQQGRQGTTGGIETKEAVIAYSNIALKDPVTGNPTRVKYRQEVQEVSGVKKMRRIRVAQKSGKDV
jgi:large subunit ribosomal protein L24